MCKQPGDGSMYESLIVFTGVTAAAGSVSFLGRVLGWMWESDLEPPMPL